MTRVVLIDDHEVVRIGVAHRLDATAGIDVVGTGGARGPSKQIAPRLGIRAKAGNVM